MRMRTALVITPLILMALVSAFSGCILNPKEEITETKKDPIEWPDMTHKEDCITVILLTYKQKSVDSHYENALHKDYVFNLQPDDWDTYGQHMFWEDEIRQTRVVFRYFTSQLSLEINPYPDETAWTPIYEIEGKPCDNCWTTTRGYEITAQAPGSDPLHANDKVTIIIVPNPNNTSKYQILFVNDIKDG